MDVWGKTLQRRLAPRSGAGRHGLWLCPYSGRAATVFLGGGSWGADRIGFELADNYALAPGQTAQCLAAGLWTGDRVTRRLRGKGPNADIHSFHALPGRVRQTTESTMVTCTAKTP